MIKRVLFPFLLVAAAVFAYSCDTGLQGNLNENLPPKTFLTVDQINLPEGDRLVSQVNISWWGDDPDGYVVGFEFKIGEPGESDWVFTTRTDSTFILPIEEGEMDADVRFTVRAIDNDGDYDPDPPSLVFPIRNSPPEIEFAMFETPPDTTYRVSSFGWSATDPDGDANLNRIEFAINDTSSWNELPVNINFITLLIDDTLSEPEAEVLSGRAAGTTGITLTGFNMDGDNTMYFRAIDNAGAVSNVIEHTWFIKQQRSNILFLNDFEGPNSMNRENLHKNFLAEIGITEVDYLNISDGNAVGGRRVPFTAAFHDRSLAAPTNNLALAQWDHIYWISDNLDRNIGYAIEITLDFFENGGSMFVNVPTKRLDPENSLFDFLPFERMESLPSGQQSFRLENNAAVTPVDDPNAPTVFSNRRQDSLYPIVPFGGTVELYEGDFRVQALGQTSDFDGSKLIAATDPDQTIVFFGIDLGTITEASDRVGLIDYLVTDILGFSQ